MKHPGACPLVLLLAVAVALAEVPAAAQAPPGHMRASPEFQGLVGEIVEEFWRHSEVSGRRGAIPCDKEAVEHAAAALTYFRGENWWGDLARGLAGVVTTLLGFLGFGPVLDAIDIYNVLVDSETSLEMIAGLVKVAVPHFVGQTWDKVRQGTPYSLEDIIKMEPTPKEELVEEYFKKVLGDRGVDLVTWVEKSLGSLPREYLEYETRTADKACHTRLHATWDKRRGAVSVKIATRCDCDLCRACSISEGSVNINFEPRLERDGSGPPRWKLGRLGVEVPPPSCCRPLGGVWEARAGGTTWRVRITTSGDRATGTNVTSGRETLRMRIEGGNRLTGEILAGKRPEDSSSRWSPIELSISPDRTAIAGRWKAPRYRVKSGEILPESQWQWESIEYSRVTE